MRNKFIFICLNILIVLSLVTIAACGGGDSPATSPPTPTATTPAKPAVTPTTPAATTTAPTTPATTPTPDVQPKYGGILKLPLSAEPAAYDLHFIPSNIGYYSQSIFSSLLSFRLDRLTGATMENVIGDLAEKWDISADNLVYTFYLRQGVKWHDGAPFTADDVVYSIEKMKDKTRAAISFYYVNVEKAEKVDDYTVKITLTEPMPTFLLTLAQGYSAMQAAHLAGTDARSTDFLIGTGPFMFESYTSGSKYTVVRNPDYFKKDAAGNQLPYLDGVTNYTIPDRSAHIDAFVSGRLDMGDTQAGLVNQEEYDRIKKEAPDAITAFTKSTIGETFWFNTDYAPLSDLRVRQAMTLLIDWPTIRTAAAGGPEWATYDEGLFTKPYGLEIEEINKLMGWDQPMEQRIAQAQQLMKDAGYPDGFSLDMKCMAITNYQDMLLVAGDLFRRHLNIDSTLTPIAIPNFTATRMSKDWQFIVAAPITFGGDPNDLVKYFEKGGGLNWLGYDRPDLDELWDKQGTTTDLAERVKITQQLEREILTDLWVMPGSKHTMARSWQPYVKGVVFTYYGNYNDMSTVWMDQ